MIIRQRLAWQRWLSGLVGGWPCCCFKLRPTTLSVIYISSVFDLLPACASEGFHNWNCRLHHVLLIGFVAAQSLPFANGPNNKVRVGAYATVFFLVGMGAPFIIAKWTYVGLLWSWLGSLACSGPLTCSGP